MQNKYSELYKRLEESHEDVKFEKAHNDCDFRTAAVDKHYAHRCWKARCEDRGRHFIFSNAPLFFVSMSASVSGQNQSKPRKSFESEDPSKIWNESTRLKLPKQFWFMELLRPGCWKAGFSKYTNALNFGLSRAQCRYYEESADTRSRCTRLFFVFSLFHFDSSGFWQRSNS